MRRGERLLHAYVTVVTVAGLAALVFILAGPSVATARVHWPQVAVLGLCAVVGELRPVTIVTRYSANGSGSFTTSSAFAFALLLMAGPAAAATSLAIGTLLADIGRGWQKAAYNLGQYCLSVLAAGFVMERLSGDVVLMQRGSVEPSDVVPLIAGALAFYVVNGGLIGAVLAIAQRSSIIRSIVSELLSEAPVDCLLLGMSPVVVVVSTQTLGLIPLLLAPVLALYRSAKASLDKEHQALHDALTGLPNRVFFHHAVGAGIEARPEGTFAVMLIDLDRFKEINDTLGHHIGDLLLREVGPRLREAVREEDLVARFGGDEFAIYVPDVGNVEQALEIAGRARAALADPFTVEDLQLHVEGSVGIALAPEHGTDVDTLLQRADVAMYIAKESHGGSRLYTPDEDPNSRRRLRLLSDLRAAIENRELVLHYQPKADLRTRHIGDVEALVRWMHPELGLVPPNDFIPLAERSGLIAPLTEFVLSEAIERAADWRRRNVPLRV